MNPYRLALHGTMLADNVRNRALVKAVESVVEPGDVVVDVGTGAGLLALAAARSGASKVYGLEVDAMAAVATRLAAANGYADVIEVVRTLSLEWEPPERADVLLCETLGFTAFEEGFRSTFADARDRLLRPGGRMLPGRVTVLAVPVDTTAAPVDLQGLGELEGFDFGPFADLCRGVWQRSHFPVASRLADPVPVADLDTRSMPAADRLAGHHTVTIQRDATLAGLALWFEAELAPGIWMGSGSADRDNHWGQAFLGLDRRPVRAGEPLGFEIELDDRRGPFRASWGEITEPM